MKNSASRKDAVTTDGKKCPPSVPCVPRERKHSTHHRMVIESSRKGAVNAGEKQHPPSTPRAPRETQNIWTKTK